MVTLFTTAKPFRGHNDVIQRNAIASWTHLTPRPEIILFGDDEGAAQVASQFGIQHVPDILRNEFGTPRVDGLFDAAQRLTSGPALCYINADIILIRDFMDAIQQVVSSKKRFLMVGQRWDLDVTVPIDFGQDWESALRNQVRQTGQLHPVTGIDYFVFSRSLWGEIPAFAIGRTTWDNWLLYRARDRKAAVIDATSVITAIHQNHDYGHHPDGERGVWYGKEAEGNQMLAGYISPVFTLYNATYLLTPRGLRRSFSRPRIRQHLATLPVLYPSLTIPIRAVFACFRVVKYVGARLGLRSSTNREIKRNWHDSV